MAKDTGTEVQVYNDGGELEAAMFVGHHKVAAFYNCYSYTPTLFKRNVVSVVLRLGFSCGRWRKTEWGWKCTTRR